jgi:dUTPase
MAKPSTHYPAQSSLGVPRRATTGSVELDICATTRLVLTPEMCVQMIVSNFKGPLPKNTIGLLLGRSSAAIKGLIIHPGVIDPDYEGEVKIMVSSPRGVSAFSPGDITAQIFLLPSHHASFPSRGMKRK